MQVSSDPRKNVMPHMAAQFNRLRDIEKQRQQGHTLSKSKEYQTGSSNQLRQQISALLLKTLLRVVHRVVCLQRDHF